MWSAMKPRRWQRPLVAWFVVSCALISRAQVHESVAEIERLRTAGQFLIQGDLKRAEDEVQLVLTASPDDFRALNLLGIIRAQQNRSKEAELLFKKAILLKPDYAAAHASLGLLCSETTRPDEAIAELELALKLDPVRKDASRTLVRVLRVEADRAFKAGEMEKSLSLLVRAQKVSPNDAELNYEFGMVALRMSLFDDARAAFEKVLGVRTDDAKAIYGLARAQMGLNRISAAKELFERYLQLKPDDATGYFGLGLVLHVLGAAEGARRQFERSIELQSSQTESYVQLGFLDLEDNSLDQAESHFRIALQRAPQNAGALLGMGRIEFQRKEYVLAADTLRAAVAADTSIPQAHYYLALSCARLGRSKESAEQMETATRLDREDLDRHRIVLKLLEPKEAESLEKENF